MGQFHPNLLWADLDTFHLQEIEHVFQGEKSDLEVDLEMTLPHYPDNLVHAATQEDAEATLAAGTNLADDTTVYVE